MQKYCQFFFSTKQGIVIICSICDLKDSNDLLLIFNGKKGGDKFTAILNFN